MMRNSPVVGLMPMDRSQLRVDWRSSCWYFARRWRLMAFLSASWRIRWPIRKCIHRLLRSNQQLARVQKPDSR